MPLLNQKVEGKVTLEELCSWSSKFYVGLQIQDSRIPQKMPEKTLIEFSNIAKLTINALFISFPPDSFFRFWLYIVTKPLELYACYHHLTYYINFCAIFNFTDIVDIFQKSGVFHQWVPVPDSDSSSSSCCTHVFLWQN